MGELKQRGRAGSQSSSSSDRDGSLGERSSVSSLSHEDDFGGERRIAVKSPSSKLSPDSANYSSGSGSDRTFSFRPRMITAVTNMSFRSVNSDNESVDSEFASLTGVYQPGMSSKIAGGSSFRGGSSKKTDDDEGAASSSKRIGVEGNLSLSSSIRSVSRRGESFKRNPLKLGVSGVTIIEGDEADGEFAEAPSTAREQGVENGIGDGGVGRISGGPDPLGEFSSYHLSYLMGVKAGAKAAAEGAIGGETTDSGNERTRAAGGGRGGFAGGGDDPYWLGYSHGREHGLIELDGTTPYDIETGQPLTLEERMSNLNRAYNARTQETDSYFDTPSAFEQFIINTCCCRGPSMETLCCQRGCCCFNRDTTDVCWVATCGLGSVVGFVVFLGMYF